MKLRYLLRVCLTVLTAALWLRCTPDRHALADNARRVDKTPADLLASAVAFPDTAERRALYRDLIAVVRHYHVFATQTAANLDLDWDKVLQELEPAFVDAPDLPALREALERLSASLHDMHLGYESGQPSELLRLGLVVEGIWRRNRAEYWVKAVSNPALRERVQPGDLLVTVNGIAAEQLPRVYLDRSRGNSWAAVTAGVARFLTSRKVQSSRTHAGDIDHWRLHRPGVAATYELDLKWATGEDSSAAVTELRTDPDYLAARCHPYESEFLGNLRDVHYTAAGESGGYRLTGYGRNFCLYTAEKPPYSYYPIIRHYAFFYYPGLPRDHEEDDRFNNEATYAVAAEYFTLSRLLRARPATRGLIVDLRDNPGGNDPEWFLDWYAPAPYEDQYIGVRVAPEWREAAFTAKVVNIDEVWLKWYRQAATGVAPGQLLKRPFKCLRSDCRGENRFTPAHALLKVPVALLVNRNCQSSCAHFANAFDEYDFGPLIGEPAPATYSSQIYSHSVRTRSGLDLGVIKLALNDTTSGKTGRSIEGFLPAVDYPVAVTFANRDTQDAEHVAAALRAFQEYRFPKHVAALGP